MYSIRVNLTQSHIVKGTPWRGSSMLDPVALAVSDVVLSDVKGVSGVGVYMREIDVMGDLRGGGFEMWIADMPRKVRRWLKRFNTGGEGEPIQFELKMLRVI